MKIKNGFVLKCMIVLVVTIITMTSSYVFATDSTIEEINQILNDEGKLVVTESTMLEDKEYFLWEYLRKYTTNTYTFNATTVDAENSIYYIEVPGKGGQNVEVVFADDVYSDAFKSILKDGKLQIPASNRNNVPERVSDYLYIVSDNHATNKFNITNPMTYNPFIDEGCTKVTLRMTDKDGKLMEQHVVELSFITEQSDEFKSVLKNGKFVFDAAKPENEEGLYILWDLLFSSEGREKPYGISNIAEDLSSFDFIFNYGKVNQEIHTVQAYYNYDTEVKTKLQGFIDNFPKDKNYFLVKDLELVNYWVNNVENDDSEHLDQFSGELKAAINNNNIKYYVDNRAGGYSPFTAERLGMAMFTMDDIIYYTDETLGTKADYIIYVPDETGNSKEALIAAAQKRINEYLGEDSKANVAVSYAGTVLDIWVARMYEYTKYEWYEWEPDMTIEEWKWGYMPAYEDFGKDVLEIDGVGENDPVFNLNVKIGNKEGNFDFLIKKDSSKMIVPSYKTVDMKTEIEISSTNTSIPLDTSIQAEKITEGDEYDRIIDILGVEDNAMYDLSLYSASLNGNVTKLENDSFEVRLPIPSELAGKDLMVYYVDENGNKEKHTVPPSDDDKYAVFTTNHFSIYTLAEKTESEEEKYQVVFDAVNGKFKNGKATLTIEEWENEYEKTLEKPTREGYKFLGYYTSKTGGTKFENYLAEAGIDKDLTFYAQWEKVSNGGQTGNNPQTGDNLFFYIGMLFVALIGIIATTKIKQYSKIK